MRIRVLTILFICSLFVAVGGDAQSPKATEKPVWTLEFFKVRLENFGTALGDLDDHYMTVLREAQREGAVVSYHRIADSSLRPALNEDDPRCMPQKFISGVVRNCPRTIIIVTEYKDAATFTDHFRLFASIMERLPSATPGVMRQSQKDLYELVDSRVFMEVPYGDTEWRLLAKQ
jgi:hypothetical protein